MKILKRLNLILIALGVVVITLGTILLIKVKKDDVKLSEGSLSIKEIESNDLYNKSITEFQKIYSSSDKFEIEENDSKVIYIQNLIDNYNYDTSYLKDYTCDFEKSYFVIFNEDNEQKIGINLFCN